MRDAIGGTFMLRILIIFIAFYIIFMCFAVAYAKTFRLKNNVIDRLEHSQFQGSGDSGVINDIDEYLYSNDYNFPGANHSQVSNHCTKVSGNVSGNLTSKGACIVPKDSGNNRYYQVYLYIVYYFPFFHWEVVMPVGGETEVIPEEVILE